MNNCIEKSHVCKGSNNAEETDGLLKVLQRDRGIEEGVSNKEGE